MIAFNLSGIGAVNPDCASHWKSDPYCSGKIRWRRVGANLRRVVQCRPWFRSNVAPVEPAGM